MLTELEQQIKEFQEKRGALNKTSATESADKVCSTSWKSLSSPSLIGGL